MKIKCLLPVIVLIATLSSCSGRQSSDASQNPTIYIEGFTEEDASDWFADQPSKAETPANTKPASKPQSRTKAAQPAKQQPAAVKATKETIYVESDDSRGRVWGHVTMQGDRGTGTIHDEGENTWAVTVTRHGNELFAVDQNSRQYVFKLKKK